MLAQLLYIASQKMRVFGYNMLNGYSEDPNEALATLEDISNRAIKNLYRSRVNEKNTLDKSQMEVVDLFQSLSPRRLLVSAPTSYGKTFLMREIVFLNKDRYNNILLVFPTEAFKSLKDVLEHKIPKILSLFESIVVFVAKQEGIGVETFSLSRVRRYYETGVKSLLGEALIEYGFPTDAIRRIEENHKKIKSMTVSEAKEYCRLHFREVQLLLDTYERSLFIKAMRIF